MEKKNNTSVEEKGHNIVVMDSRRVSGAQPPETFTGLKVGKIQDKAAGVKGVTTALGHASKYMAPGKAFKTMFKLNQKGGFDCPGCAWPDPDDERSKLGEYCENGMKAIAEEAQKKTIDRVFFAHNSIAEMREWSDYEIGKKGRLSEPLVLREGSTHYEPISWEEAFKMIGEELRGLDTPDRAVFYTSGRASNEAAFLYQLFVREYGTNNLPDCSNMCHESSGQGLSQTVGIGKGSVTLTDLYEAEVVMVIGQNPGTNHPRMLSALERCKENGGKIITVNPLPEAGLQKFINPQRPGKMLTGGTKLTDLFLQVKINGDIALLKAIMLQLLHEERKNPGTVFDWDFIQEKTDGYEAFIESLKQHDFEDLVKASGVSREQIKEAAQMLKKSKKIIICWAMGLTQHENGVDNIREVVNLLLLKGSIGKPGAGTCPVRGHSNVQGDRTVGIWEAPKPAFLDKLKETFGFEPPRKHGFAVVDAIKAMHEGEASVFFALGGNFLSATPDTEYTAEALQRCNLTVQVSTKLNRSHLIHGKRALILPCLGRTDQDMQEGGQQFVSVENSMGVVHTSQGVLTPPSDKLKSEPAIIAGVAKATLGADSKVDWDKMIQNYDHIRDAIEQVVPGFEDYNQRVREPGGFYLPNGAREQKFNTPSGKAIFSVTAVPNKQVGDGEFIMMTVRSHDQFNTTIYGLNDRYRGIYNERRVVMMNQEDIVQAGLKSGQVVDLIGQYKGQVRTARKFIVVPYDIPRRCIATYFPEANVLVPIDAYAKGSKTPESKWVAVQIRMHE
ncbi:MAG: FdhF/YdeP family oxidoreductase [Phaeodactylibacter xiamenensis]|nr:FdhF/YdeP family oxidoreductase [Phaeodactylibacter xiamenensis]MCR9051546.1 FdhF/YdeP family oxidoreductase [bacterium]